MFCLINENCIEIAFTIHYAQLTLYMGCVYLSCLLLSITLGVVISKTNEANGFIKVHFCRKGFGFGNSFHYRKWRKHLSYYKYLFFFEHTSLFVFEYLYVYNLIDRYTERFSLFTNANIYNQPTLYYWMNRNESLKNTAKSKYEGVGVCVHSPERVGHD